LGGWWWDTDDRRDSEDNKPVKVGRSAGETNQPGDPAFLPGVSGADFVLAVAKFLWDLHAIHPFRKGIGRSQLAFQYLVALRAGHPLRLRLTESATFPHAIIWNLDGDLRFAGRPVRRDPSQVLVGLAVEQEPALSIPRRDGPSAGYRPETIVSWLTVPSGLVPVHDVPTDPVTFGPHSAEPWTGVCWVKHIRSAVSVHVPEEDAPFALTRE
jgi:hypothetical protein